jgi:hypothetical protein
MKKVKPFGRVGMGKKTKVAGMWGKSVADIQIWVL